MRDQRRDLEEQVKAVKKELSSIQQMGKGALIACGFIVLCVIIYTGLHYAGVA